jgi:hypothetical protein
MGWSLPFYEAAAVALAVFGGLFAGLLLVPQNRFSG